VCLLLVLLLLLLLLRVLVVVLLWVLLLLLLLLLLWGVLLLVRVLVGGWRLGRRAQSLAPGPRRLPTQPRRPTWAQARHR
jgi:hypothetical protein